MNKKMHICFLQYSLRGGGAERKVCTLANYFASCGHTVEIGLFGANDIAYKLDERVKVTFIRRNSFEYKNKAGKAVYKLKSGVTSAAGSVLCAVNKKSGSRFKAHFNKVNDYTLPFQRYILSRPNAVFISMMVSVYLEVLRVMDRYWHEKITVPYIVMDCSDPKRNADAAMNKKRNEKYPMADRVLVMTQEAKNWFIEDIQKKCEVVPNPLRDDLPEVYTGERKKIVVNFCRLNIQKNLKMLIDAFAIFHERFPDYRLDQYGQGELYDELKEYIEKSGLSGCARILPFDSDIHNKIRDHAMFVSSSDWEGFPNSVLEALCMGIPTISTDCDFGPRDMITDHKNGTLVPVGDANALANAMIELATDPGLSAQYSKEAVKLREVYSAKTIGQRWLDLIEKVALERGII